MSEELRLEDFELTGEIRVPRSGDVFFCTVWPGPRVEVCMDVRVGSYPILRRKPEPVHNWAWACNQMRDRKMVTHADAGDMYWLLDGDRVKYKERGRDFCVATPNMMSFFTRTDWRLYEEPKTATEELCEKLRMINVEQGGWEALCDVLNKFESRLAELEKEQ